MTVETQTGLAFPEVGAVVLAAGLSTRMGRPKQLLAWRGGPMVRHVVDLLLESGISPEHLVLVVGYLRAQVEAAVAGAGVRPVFNPGFDDGSMLRSLQLGLAELEAFSVQAALVVLSDQPQLKPALVAAVVLAWRQSGALVVAPSYRGRRGHPILFDRRWWPDVLSAAPVGSPRELVQRVESQVAYVPVEDDAVLQDIDTPDDYARAKADNV